MCDTGNMKLRKYRWSRDYESAEEELEEMLKRRKFDAQRWEADPAEDFPVQTDNFDKQIWCAEGSIVFTVTNANGVNQQFSLQPGDALDLPANTPYSAAAGMTGAVCYESHVQPRL